MTWQADKDTAVAKEHFGLAAPYDAMSPLVLEKGYTKAFLDGKVDLLLLKNTRPRGGHGIFFFNDPPSRRTKKANVT